MVQTLQTSALPFNDLVLNSSNSLTMLSGIEAVTQACTNACLTQLGECVLQTGVGLPNFGLIWVGVPDYAIWQTYLQQTLLDVPGVTQVDSIKLTAQNKVLTYTALIQTIYGPTTISQTLTPNLLPIVTKGTPTPLPSSGITWGDGTTITSGSGSQIDWSS